jgi:O-antigen ligase
MRSRIVGFSAVLLFSLLIAFPLVNAFTDGALLARFTNTDLTHRDQLLEADLLIFQEHPFFGTGPGMAAVERSNLAHTEFSRALSEHGLFGACALLLLIFMSVRRLWNSLPAAEKAFSAALLIWSLLYMAANGMRIAAPAFSFGFAWATLRYAGPRSNASGLQGAARF